MVKKAKQMKIKKISSYQKLKSYINELEKAIDILLSKDSKKITFKGWKSKH